MFRESLPLGRRLVRLQHPQSLAERQIPAVQGRIDVRAWRNCSRRLRKSSVKVVAECLPSAEVIVARRQQRAPK